MKNIAVKFYFILLGIIALSTIPCSATTYKIRLNQVGFLPNSLKYAAVVGSEGTSFSVQTSDQSSTVFTGELSEASYYSSSDEDVMIADFSDLTTPGDYVLVVDDLGTSVKFTIDDEVFLPISRATIKGFYYNRASTAILAEYGGKWARAAGHPDTVVVVHPSGASAERPAGTIISTPYGWYDAGDYNKYVVNSGISTYTLLSAYETYPDYFDTLTWNIPESSNEIPDILDEAWWNIKWLWTMQDTNDGGVYNKTTAASFESSDVSPSEASSTRYVITKTTAAALDFAAIMAVTARVYEPYWPDVAAEAVEKAKSAYAWAKANPDIPFEKPSAEGDYPRISTGSYGDSHFEDEFAWCAAELYVTTGDDQYYSAIGLDTASYAIPNSGTTGVLGLISLLVNKENLTAIADTALAKQKLLNLMENSKNKIVNTPYRIPGDNFGWGGNGIYANTGMLLMQAYKISHDPGYFNAAVATLDYLLGKNATTYCFVTGQGTKKPTTIHHRISNTDGVSAPTPGQLVGGPSAQFSDCDGVSSYPSELPAKAYLDKYCSYTTNEVAINWDAPIAFLVGAIQSEYIANFKDAMAPYMMTSESDINFAVSQGGSTKLVLMSNMDWKLSTNVSWIDFSATSGSGNASITVSTNETNSTGSDREAYILVSSDDEVLDTVFVTQNGVRLNFTIEAEDFLESTSYGVQSEETSDDGGGSNLSYVDAEDWADYKVDVSYAGIYQVTIRHAGYAGDFDVITVSNGEVIASGITTSETDDWQVWMSTTFELPLKAGEDTLRILFNADGLNVNWLYFEWKEDLPVTINQSNIENVLIYPIPTDKTLTIETNNTCEINNWQMISMDGKKVNGQDVPNLSSLQINTSELNSGLYILLLNTNQGVIRKMVTVE